MLDGNSKPRRVQCSHWALAWNVYFLPSRSVFCQLSCCLFHLESHDLRDWSHSADCLWWEQSYSLPQVSLSSSLDLLAYRWQLNLLWLQGYMHHSKQTLFLHHDAYHHLLLLSTDDGFFHNSSLYFHSSIAYLYVVYLAEDLRVGAFK